MHAFVCDVGDETQVEEAFAAAVYLASDASSYTTGEQFLIDGGYAKC